MSDVIYDEILGKLRTDEGGGGGGGTSYVFDESQFTVSGDSVSITGTVPTATTASGLANTAVDYRMIVSNGAASFNPFANIVNATGATVTLVPDTAYKIQATASAVTLDATVPPDGQWAYEGHAEIFVAGTGYVQTTGNVILANALEPDAVNNCTVRFHDGYAIISVEDHVAGYIVSVNAASGAGSLAYGLSTATNEYISVDASLNGQTLDLAGATTYTGEKHVVGNGYAETVLSGGIVCTSKTTFSNLSMDGVVVSSGTMTLGDVNIPSGATVAVSGGGLAIEKVTGNGGVIDLGGKNVNQSNGITANVSGLLISGGSAASTGGAFGVYAHPSNVLNISGTTITGCSAGGRGGAIYAETSATINLTDSVIVGNNSYYGKDIAASLSTINMSNCVIGNLQLGGDNTVNVFGSLTVSTSINTFGGTPTSILNIHSGAIVDLTGNANATPIAPGGAVIVDGGCTVINSAGTTVSIAGGTYTKINKDGTTN